VSDLLAPFALRRFKGGFRRIVDTELGVEQWCAGCGESWPADHEFYAVTATSLGYECKACTAERRASKASTSARQGG
jgi:hypothetical protein